MLTARRHSCLLNSLTGSSLQPRGENILNETKIEQILNLSYFFFSPPQFHVPVPWVPETSVKCKIPSHEAEFTGSVE